MIINVHEVQLWLRAEEPEEEILLELLIGAAEEYLKNATGKTFDKETKLAKIFCLVLVTDWFENRELIGSKPSEKIRFTVESMLTQLQYLPEGVQVNG